MKKHILRIIVTVLILSVIGGGVWFFFFKPGDDSVIYNDLVALSKTIDKKNQSIINLKNANSIGDKEKYLLDEVVVENPSDLSQQVFVFKEATLIRGLMFNGNISEFDSIQDNTDHKLKNNYESLFASHNNINVDKDIIIKNDALNKYTYEMYLNKFTESDSYSLDYLFNTLDSSYDYYVLLSKTATGVNKSAQDEIKNAMNKFSNALNTCTSAINEIIAYQKLINKEDATIGSAKVYTLTRMYGDVKNNFMSMFSNYVDLIVKVKNYDIKHVFNNNFVHDERTAYYESALYSINNMASRATETTTPESGDILNIDKNWYNALYDACVVVNTYNVYSNYETVSKENYINKLKTIYTQKDGESENDYTARIESKYNYLIQNFSSYEKQFVIAFNNIYKNANKLITETKIDGASLFVKNNLTKTKIAIGDETELANIALEYRSDVSTIISFLGYKEFVVEIPAVKGE